MAERLSTGLRNLLLGGKAWREAFEDAVIKIYSGSQPATVDEAVTTPLLMTVTKSSQPVSSNERSTPGRWSITIPGEHAEGTYAVTITVDGTAYTCTYNTADPEGHADNDAIAKGLARKIREGCPQVFAIAEGANSKLYIQGRVGGVDIDVVDGGGTVTIVTLTEIEIAARCDALHFGKPASGSMPKASETWSGQCVLSGVAGFYRMVLPDDDGGESTTAIRKQGAISTTGAEINLASQSLVAGLTYTIDNYAINQPAE